MKIDKINKENIHSFSIGKFQILKIEGCEVLVRYFEHFSPLNEDPLYIIEVGPMHKKINNHRLLSVVLPTGRCPFTLSIFH